MPVASYSKAPLVAWAGWRMRIPGGPQGGQYHGFIAPDDLVDDAGGWPAGHDEIFRPIDNRQNLGIYPWAPWDHAWVGSPLREGQTVSDYVYRSPAEVRPRPNATGGHNVIRSVQLVRTPGYAVAPGNYRTLGSYMGAGGGPSANVIMDFPPEHACPAWGCGVPPWARGGVVQPVVPPISPRPGPVVTQPPPPIYPGSAPTIPIGPGGSSGCAVGQYRDAAGNCVGDWRLPYPFLPLDNAPAPAPTVAASTCPTGYTQDPSSGNCLAPGTCPTGYVINPTTGQCSLSSSLAATPSAGIMGWLEGSTSLPVVGNVPNWGIAAAVGLVAMKMMGGGRRR